LPLPTHGGEDRRDQVLSAYGGDLHQRSSQPRQSLLLRARPFFQEDAGINVWQTSSGRRVWLMNDECVTVRWLPAKEPGITIWAAVQVSPIWHIGAPCLPLGIACVRGPRGVPTLSLKYPTETFREAALSPLALPRCAFGPSHTRAAAVRGGNVLFLFSLSRGSLNTGRFARM